MNSSEFLKQFVKVENHLYSLAPTLDKREGLFALIKYLKDHDLIPEEIFRETVIILKQRNKIVSFLEFTLVDEEAIKAMEVVRQYLNVLTS